MLKPAPKPDGRAMLFVFVTVLLSLVGLGIIIPVMPSLLKELTGEGPSRAAELNGILLFVYAIMQFIMSPILGALSDRFGRRPVILISLLAYAFDFLLMALAPTFAWLFLGRMLSGATAATYSTANAFIADITPPEQRAGRFGMLGAAFGLGFIIGPALGGLSAKVGPWIASMVEASNPELAETFIHLGPRIPFFLASAVIFGNFVFGYFFFPETLTEERRRKFSWLRANPLGGLYSVGRRPLLAGIMIAYFLMQVAHHSLPAIWAFYATAQFAWSELDIGLSLAYVGITAAIVQGGLVRKVVPKIGDVRAVLIGMASMTTSFIGYAFFTPTGSWIFLWVTIGALGGFMMPGMQSKMSEATPPDAQGELQGAIASLMSISMAFSPLMMTRLFGYYTEDGTGRDFPGAPFALSAVLITISALIFFFTTRSLLTQKPTEEAAS